MLPKFTCRIPLFWWCFKHNIVHPRNPSNFCEAKAERRPSCSRPVKNAPHAVRAFPYLKLNPVYGVLHWSNVGINHNIDCHFSAVLTTQHFFYVAFNRPLNFNIAKGSEKCKRMPVGYFPSCTPRVAKSADVVNKVRAHYLSHALTYRKTPKKNLVTTTEETPALHRKDPQKGMFRKVHTRIYVCTVSCISIVPLLYEH